MVKITEKYTFVTLINRKYFVDVRLDFTHNGEHGLTGGAVFLKHVDDSDEYGEGVCQQLLFRSLCSKEEKRFVKKEIETFYESLNTFKIIIGHLEENLRYFKSKEKKGPVLTLEDDLDDYLNL